MAGERKNKRGQTASRLDKKTPETAMRFLAALELCPVVSRAARAAGISRALAYTWKADGDFVIDPGDGLGPRTFAALWQEHLDEGLDEAEGVMHDYATGSAREPVLFNGQLMFETEPVPGQELVPGLSPKMRFKLDGAGQPIPLTIRKVDLRTTHTWLKAHRREKWGDNVKVDQTVRSGGVLVVGREESEEEWERKTAEQQRKYREAGQ